ncbi:MAG TPA: hypothetical protein VLA54_01300, partial [Acidimicrobiia bacterium]|nr:hypothetical protein [Acidimicrobiia bacterium]
MTAAPGDWRPAAATEAIARLSTALRPGFGRRSWEEFSTRLARHGQPLFDLVHHLYGWRYDFAWIFEDLVQVAAASFQARRRALRRADQDLEASLDWLSDPGSLWATAPPDPPLERLVTELADQADLEISHLHISSPYPPGLRRLARQVRELQIGLVLDLNCHQTNSDHPWAQAATAGDPRFRAFYHIFPDRVRPDRYARHLQERRAGPGGDSFTWHPDVNGGAWVWTTGHPDRWDLDYANPAVLKAMAAEVLSLANLGAAVIRLDGARFLWKAEGTSCEDLPESHLVVQIMRVLTDLAAPSVL